MSHLYIRHDTHDADIVGLFSGRIMLLHSIVTLYRNYTAKTEEIPLT